MHGGVVKLNALPDADRAGAKHKNFLFLRDKRFIFLFIGRIEIGNIAFKLRGAGVDHLIYGEEAQLFAQRINGDLVDSPKLGDRPIGKAHSLGFI